MPSPKVVFDTNVFLRALINPKGVNARLVRSADRYLLITSPDIVEEVVEVLSRVDLLSAKSIRTIDVDRMLAHLKQAPMVTPTVGVRVCRDTDDDKFLEAALSAQANYVVTGDKDLRALDGYKGIKIRFPAEFLAELEKF